MQISKWGNSLAVRLPADLVRELGLKEGDRIDLHPDTRGLAVRRAERPEDILAGLRRFRGRMAEGGPLSRDEANAR
ncbi:AbrB/MazE/SpoVT family DNA-binding domain-containing protein (plasmid) [Salipiger sp. H15]|uniref:AbrB/MazE/SpoVT family DNA-binding domain-containing protein n=1 Tax=Alloyangia sp. H15 TaxID=3029062 RepID=A0AAU8AQU7_9RHOB